LAKARNKVKKSEDRLSTEKTKRSDLSASLEESEASFEKFDTATAKISTRIKELESLAEICGNKVRNMLAAFESNKTAEAAATLEQYKNIAKELGISIDDLDTMDTQTAL